MKRHLIVFIVIFFIVSSAFSQELAVKTFRVITSDLSAQTQSRKDLNDKNCALIKVGIGLQNVQFEGNIVGKVVNKVGEYWVYMPQGCRMLKVKHPNYSPIMVTFANYGIEKLESNRTYQLTMTASSSSQTAQQQTFTLKYSPSSAMVLVDSKLVKGTNGVVETTLPVGQHSYMVICDGYETEEGTVKLKSSAPSKIQIVLSKATLPIVEDEIVSTNKKQQTNEQEVTTLRENIASIADVSQQENIVKPSLTGNLVTIPVKNGVSIEMVKVELGSMTMTYGNGLTKLLVGKLKVRVVQDYYIGKYEVTQALWQAVMGNNPSKNKGNKLPVEKVTWNECQEFIKELNKLTGKKFRLPTTLEWVYAARGGNRSHGYKYSGSNKLSEVAWYDSNSKNTTHPVGTKLPNELGLYDMSGNVWEWCQDIGNTSKKSSKSSHGSYRILCGGSWSDNAKYCSSLYMDEKPESFYSIYTGLRLVLSE